MDEEEEEGDHAPRHYWGEDAEEDCDETIQPWQVRLACVRFPLYHPAFTRLIYERCIPVKSDIPTKIK